jgi:nucleotide-binding universal stress UspA family protein
MFKRILIPLDLSPLAEQAIGRAVAIARASKAEIDLVSVHQPMPFGGFNDAPWNPDLKLDEHKYLETVAAEVTSGSSVPATHAILKGEAVDMICKRAWDVDADLIVMTSHGRTGLSRVWFGSVADRVLRHSAVPVLMLRPVDGKKRADAARHLFKHVLIPLDGSAFATDILPSAVALAKCSDARVTLLRVIEPIPLLVYGEALPLTYPPLVQDETATNRLVAEATEELAGIARGLREQGIGLVDAEVVVAGHVAQTIVEFARTHDVDAIAMSTHGRGASRFLMGSVADKVLRASGLPLLLHRPLGVRGADQPVESSDSSVPLLAPA